MAAAGGIIQAAMDLVKEKERQGDKAMDRLHDGFKNQMQLTAVKAVGRAMPSRRKWSRRRRL